VDFLSKPRVLQKARGFWFFTLQPAVGHLAFAPQA
jgi:hypothetical protein